MRVRARPRVRVRVQLEVLQGEPHLEPSAVGEAQDACDIRRVLVGRSHQFERAPPGGGAIGRVRRLRRSDQIPIAERETHIVKPHALHRLEVLELDGTVQVLNHSLAGVAVGGRCHGHVAQAELARLR